MKKVTLNKKQKKVKQIDVVFENCEVFTLTPDMIEIFFVDKVTTGIGINCFQYEKGEVYETISCEESLLGINKKGLNQRGILFDDITLKERLKFNDITHYDIIYKDEPNIYVSVPWKDKDGNEYVNSLQFNFGDKDDNNVYIVIDKNIKTIKQAKEKYRYS